MKLNAQDLNKIVNLTLEQYNQRAEEFWAGTRHHDIGQNIAAMLSRVSQYLILAAGPGETLKRLPNSVRSRSVWKAPRISPTWRVPTAAAKFGSRIFSGSICRITISMVYSQTPRCFMYLARSCRACCWNCAQV